MPARLLPPILRVMLLDRFPYPLSSDFSLPLCPSLSPPPLPPLLFALPLCPSPEIGSQDNQNLGEGSGMKCGAANGRSFQGRQPQFPWPSSTNRPSIAQANQLSLLEPWYLTVQFCHWETIRLRCLNLYQYSCGTDGFAVCLPIFQSSATCPGSRLNGPCCAHCLSNTKRCLDNGGKGCNLQAISSKILRMGLGNHQHCVWVFGLLKKTAWMSMQPTTGYLPRKIMILDVLASCTCALSGHTPALLP